MGQIAADTPSFVGAKIALLQGARLLVYLRDDRNDIPFPGAWDLPGGGREGGESPADCALRETEEEFGLRIAADRIHWTRRYPSVVEPGSHSYFFAADITVEEIGAIRFGDEGQFWQMMEVEAFLALPDAVGYLQNWLRDYWIQRQF